MSNEGMPLSEAVQRTLGWMAANAGPAVIVGCALVLLVASAFCAADRSGGAIYRAMANFVGLMAVASAVVVWLVVRST